MAAKPTSQPDKQTNMGIGDKTGGHVCVRERERESQNGRESERQGTAHSFRAKTRNTKQRRRGNKRIERRYACGGRIIERERAIKCDGTS
mmetsp:Transcript_34896/g.86626  ORF Transcript_34896/g.86626 Transcript_34896/m.86626 type:complete len:90 (-) Transcript_34896:54-323(-)